MAQRRRLCDVVAACAAALLIGSGGAAFGQTYGSPVFQGLTVTIPGGSYGSIVTSPAVVGSAPSLQAQETATWNPTYSGGTGTVKDVRLNQATIYGAMTDYLWVNLNSLQWAGTGGGSAQHVANYNQTVRYAYAAGGPANNPQLWAEVDECQDLTHQPSASTNAFPCVEIDQRGSGLDTYGRPLISGVIGPSTETGNLGYFVAEGYGITATAGGYANGAFGFGGAYIGSVADWRYACGYGPNESSLSSCTTPTVTGNTTSSTTLPVSNVVPFTRDYLGRDLNMYHTATNIWIGSTQYQVSGYSITGTGATPAGTLTLTTAISATSGASVYAQNNIMWLPTGHTIALDTGGVTQLWSDSTSFHLTGGKVLMPTGSVSGPWTTSGRPSSPVTGQTGYNTTIGSLETWTGSIWKTCLAATSSGGFGCVAADQTTFTTSVAGGVMYATGNVGQDPSVTTTGTNQGTAYGQGFPLTVVTTSSATAGSGVLMAGGSTGSQGIQMSLFVNAGANPTDIYPPNLGTINGSTSPLVLPAGAAQWVPCTSATVCYAGPSYGTPVTSSQMSAALASPPAIGGTTPAAGKFTSVTATAPVILPAYTVASLPACSGQQNGMAVVTDATAPTYNGALTGGGSVRVPVFCNGTSWSSH